MRFSSMLLGAGLVGASVAACGPDAAPPPHPATGVFADMGEILPTATAEQRATFERGKAVALRRFTKEEGLGPEFNATFCGACHEKPATGGGAARYRDFLIIAQTLPDGSFNNLGKSGVLDHFTLDPQSRIPTPAAANVKATRNPIPFFGVGLLAEIPGDEILKYADPNDANHDGISGRANYDRGFVGRFGRKSQTVSIEGFIRGPLFNHVGITSNPLSEALRAKLPVPSAAVPAQTGGTRSFSGGGGLSIQHEDIGQQEQAQAAAPDLPITDDDGVADPELAESDLFDLVSYTMLLAAPKADAPTPETEAGRALFQVAHCTGCHVPALDGPRGLIPAFSDLLLHDMGPDLADGVIMKTATGSEFRTQPLWGIGAVGPYLHDGRADTLDQAIRMHGGEAQASRDAYAGMTDEQRAKIVDFMLSLGGRSQITQGLLPPGAPVLDPGTYGGPLAVLAGTERDRFVAGRAIFDRDTALSSGLGPEFNGDACRSCHFDPVLGGAGPGGVNVTRQGILAAGIFTAPPEGTMLHRLAAAHGARPEPNPQCNFFEVRQPPSVLGLGLIDRIADSTILSHEDPGDLNADGIRGRAHRLADGRIGRLGWKANVPDLAEFARDAMSNEMGVTVPTQGGMTFGFTTDNDTTADPEISQPELDALVFFMQNLAPPPRTRKDPGLEDAGALVFTSVGCASCHTPSMKTEDGVDAALYSDLLLHDVTAPGAGGIVDGDAKMTEFRTAPLWGLATSAPYMHDGRAFTLEQAIDAHDGESKGVHAAYAALSPGDHAALVAFLKSL